MTTETGAAPPDPERQWAMQVDSWWFWNHICASLSLNSAMLEAELRQTMSWATTQKTAHFWFCSTALTLSFSDETQTKQQQQMFERGVRADV